MCLLCVIKPGSTPTREQLMTAADGNPHGYGYAFHCGDKIITGRGMDAEEVVDRFLRLRSGMPDTWAMFHARYTTHGETNKSNCHPFRVGGEESTVIAHNGIIPIHVPKYEHRSDTRIFAEDWLPEFLTDLDDPKGFEELEKFVGASKVAVFTTDPRLKFQVYILNEEMGHWSQEGDIWWSNYGYLPPKPYGGSLWSSKRYDNLYSYGGGNWWDEHYDTKSKDKVDCACCYAKLDKDELADGYCYTCYSCLDCLQGLADCDCFSKAGERIVDSYEDNEGVLWELTAAGDWVVSGDSEVEPTKELMPWQGGVC